MFQSRKSDWLSQACGLVPLNEEPSAGPISNGWGWVMTHMWKTTPGFEYELITQEGKLAWQLIATLDATI